MKKIILATAVLLILCRSIAFGQAVNDPLAGAVSNMKSLLTDHVIEKAFLHFDRPYPYYVAGDVVYFKAYVTMGERHQPSTLSGILHVDLIDKNDVLMNTIALPLTNGTGWGDFALPDTLAKGSYRIRAYTEWMRNDKHPYFFDQYISVSSINNVDRVSDNTAQALKPVIQFFPEGGTLVADVPSKVAFKAIGTNGLSTTVKGIVIDNEHKEVAKIAAVHAGMGAFDFTPEAGKTYKAMLTFGDGSQGTVNLPAAQEKGIRLSVNTDDPAKVSIELMVNRPYYKENLNKQLNLLVYYGGTLQRYKFKLDNAVLGLDLPTNKLRTGVLQVTLLSETNEPLAERLAFVQTQDQLNLSVAANKPVYAARENVQLNFNAKTKEGTPAIGSFSVSVVDESKILVDDDAENTILSYLLLSTDLKGNIEKPNYYFANVTKETRSALDALMLTQGFRRFVWKDLINGNTPNNAITYQPEKGMNISGQLKTKAGAPIADCSITLISVSGGTPTVQTTDSQGRFKFANVQLEGGSKYILKALSGSGKKSVLTLDKPSDEPIITAGDPADAKYNANADILASLQNQKQGFVTASNSSAVLLKEGKFNSSPNNGANYRSSNLGGPGHADQVILGSEIATAPTLSSGLNGRLRQVQFENGMAYLPQNIVITTGAAGMNTQGAVSGTVNPMLIFIDGINAGVGANIDQINPASVEAVEVLKGPNASIYGIEAAGGVLVITTKTGAEKEAVESKEMSPGIFSIEPHGFYKAREFYSPQYATQPATNLADQRTTIFWRPDVTTGTDGNASFNFYNADGKGSYRVEVQGIDSNGNLGVQVFRYKVQ